ncbi:MAG: Ig-like domain-containing protein [Candidatus Shapirobacteria bacterium]|nr:Ig-like domain-containing protein [Candidatus Shapirobacteria bacterium]
MNKKYLFIILFLSIALIASVFLVLRTTIFVKKASVGNQSSVVLENSYLFASPLQAKADNKEKIRVTVFILDGRGLGVPNQNISLTTSSQISISEVQNITDDSGKAVFDLSSNIPGRFDVTAKTKNSIIPQQVKVVFY